MPIEISTTDVELAETFLETLLTDSIPDGKFGRGTALRDLVIKAFAFVFAHMQRENETVRSLQNLIDVQKIAVTDPDTDRAVSNAVDAILSNWFITRNNGSFTRGYVTVQVSRRQDYILPGNNRFSYDRNRAFYPDVSDSSQNIIIRANELVPVIAVDGTVTGYQFKQRVVAAKTGESYNVEPATWQGGRQFSPFVVTIFNEERFSGGSGKETTAAMISRANSAIAARNLVNVKSIDATLRERFSDIVRMFVSGYGDTEMQRDRKYAAGSTLDIHVGGHTDIFVEMPRVSTVYQGLLGGRFLRPDNIVSVFRDVTNAPDWTATDIEVGDILRITSGLSAAPRDFAIKEILETELRISDRIPFSEATDEAGTFVEYYIYRPIFGPDVQMFPSVGVYTDGQTSRSVQTPNRLVLPGGPHYAISDVAVIDPDAGDPNISAADGFVHFPVRSNEEPNAVVAQEFLEYQVVNNRPVTAQSQVSFEELLLEPTYNGKTVRVTFETLAGFEAVHSYVTDRFERIVASSPLVKAYYPVYLSVNVPYRLKPTATGLVDTEGLRKAITDFINSFDPNDVIDVSDIAQVTRNFDTVNIGAVYPFDIAYELIVPDGRTIQFTTSDDVSIDPDKITDDRANSELADPVSLGVTDRTVRYMTTLDRITVEDRT